MIWTCCKMTSTLVRLLVNQCIVHQCPLISTYFVNKFNEGTEAYYSYRKDDTGEWGWHRTSVLSILLWQWWDNFHNAGNEKWRCDPTQNRRKGPGKTIGEIVRLLKKQIPFPRTEEMIFEDVCDVTVERDDMLSANGCEANVDKKSRCMR